MATRFVFTPLSAEFPSANFPELNIINRRPVLAFDAATDETVYWTGIAPQGLTGTVTVVITYMMASATSNNIIMQAALEAVSDGDATDLDAGTSFDTANSSSAVTVPGTAGYIDQVSVTLTNADSIAAGDYFRLSINRDADNGSDTATGDLYVLTVELRDAA
jgi:hypothetical protein